MRVCGHARGARMSVCVTCERLCIVELFCGEKVIIKFKFSGLYRVDAQEVVVGKTVEQAAARIALTATLGFVRLVEIHAV